MHSSHCKGISPVYCSNSSKDHPRYLGAHRCPPIAPAYPNSTPMDWVPYCKYILRGQSCRAGCTPEQVVCHKWFRGVCTHSAWTCRFGVHRRVARPKTSRGGNTYGARNRSGTATRVSSQSPEDGAYEAWVSNFRSVICSVEQLRRLQTLYHPDRVWDTPLAPLHTRISQFLNGQIEERRA